jgi:DNA-binding NtrC family response regulator
VAANILLVEDDDEQAKLYALVLEKLGYPVESVTDAAQAQARLTAKPYALLLADWDLGSGMQGDALILWAKERDPQLKTILFSNHLEVDEAAATSGADAAFRKIEGIIPLHELVTRLLPLGADHA